MKRKYSVCKCGHFRWQHSGDTGSGRCLTQGCSCKRFRKPEPFDLVRELGKRKPSRMI